MSIQSACLFLFQFNVDEMRQCQEGDRKRKRTQKFVGEEGVPKEGLIHRAAR